MSTTIVIPFPTGPKEDILQSLLRKQPEPVPVVTDKIILHMNSEWDDFPALKSWLNGDPVYYVNGTQVGEEIDLWEVSYVNEYNKDHKIASSIWHKGGSNGKWGDTQIYTKEEIQKIIEKYD